MLIKLPVTSEVYFFVLSELGRQPLQINAQNGHVVADKLYDLLTRPNRYEEYPHKEVYTHTLQVEVCPRTAKVCCFDLSQEKVFRFNKFVRQLIQDRLFLLLDALWAQRAGERPKITRIISEYIHTYNLQNSGISYDALKKAYYRYRRSEQVRLVPAIAARVA